MKYKPPFEITNDMLSKVSDIMEKIGKLDNYNSLNKMPSLRKQRRINSIHSSLAIENNKLSESQVKDVIDGRIVLGPQKEIQEVKNAYNAYQLLTEMNPYSIKDLKRIHEIIGYLTISDSGKFRIGEEGVFDGDKCIFICPPASQVNTLIYDLFRWMNENKNIVHPLILSSVFHYEFVFIHPFSDGNGRTARLWQNIILYNFKNVFEYLPIESQIYKYQDEYYNAISDCHKNGNFNVFIEFMLNMIDDTLSEVISDSVVQITSEDININKLLSVMKVNEPITANDMMKKLKIKSKETLRKHYLNPAIKEGLVKLTIPNKPTSKNQMYYKE